jgi:hypothetical protein
MGNNVTKKCDTDTIQRSAMDDSNTNKCECYIKKTNEIDGVQVLIKIIEGHKLHENKNNWPFDFNTQNNWPFDYNTRNNNLESQDTQNNTRNFDFLKSIFDSKSNSNSNLNIPELDETEELRSIFNELRNNPTFNKYQSKDNKDNKKIQTDELSDTSPFISSDMYNQLINKKLTTQKGGTNIVDDSSTSSTSSSSNKCLKTDKHSKTDKHNKTTDKHSKTTDKYSKTTDKHSKTTDKHNKTTDKHSKTDKRKGHDSPDIDYISSSGGSNNSSPEESDEESDEESTEPKTDPKSEPQSLTEQTEQIETQSGGSISNYNDDMPPSVVNTSDINMISES